MANRHTRGRSNGNEAGSSADRRARKQWLLDQFGDGTHVMCRRCWAAVLTASTVTAGRIVAGVHGGTYRRDNVQPECAHCNYSHGARLSWETRRVQSRMAVDGNA